MSVNKNVERAQKMLFGDRFGLVGQRKEIILSDVESVLDEYLYMPNGVRLELVARGDKFDLVVSATDCTLKGFNVVK